ncbi:hypothetical protein CEXT_534861 [Caerostris extrusa]|uniref:Uncharacterized protein n=1 Tax=Caerostris extrusa TaxID=172846 RepID=A0AAV4XQ51_CAEEX|nr:hypothetical protein CEXT_534861 [Caerostris extrusa]
MGFPHNEVAKPFMGCSSPLPCLTVAGVFQNRLVDRFFKLINAPHTSQQTTRIPSPIVCLNHPCGTLQNSLYRKWGRCSFFFPVHSPHSIISSIVGNFSSFHGKMVDNACFMMKR